MIDTAIKELLLEDSGITLLVGDRVYPEVLPQAVTYPAMTFQIISGQSHYHMQGPSELAASRVQFDLYAETKDKLIELKRVFMRLMSGFHNAAVRPGIIQGAFRDNEFGDVEGAIDRTNKVRRNTFDFIIWHEESYT